MFGLRLWLEKLTRLWWCGTWTREKMFSPSPTLTGHKLNELWFFIDLEGIVPWIFCKDEWIKLVKLFGSTCILLHPPASLCFEIQHLWIQSGWISQSIVDNQHLGYNQYVYLEHYAKVLRHGFLWLSRKTKISSMAFDASLRRLLIASQDGSLRMWNFNNGQCLKEFVGFGQV